MPNDQHWMEQALRQAELSVGLASPNPAVGCVLVKGEHLIAEGFHNYDHRDHAEIVALRQAAGEARGATAYVTLEPCTHHGRTGPCADALLAAGVSRVVVATVDPNPIVQGKGLARLRDAGVEVSTGFLEQAARALNDGFARYVTSAVPLVTLKVAATLDGRIAAAGGSRQVTGEAAHAEVHRLRHASDALMVGIGTILADNPLLTDRSGLSRRRPLLRVVLDSTLRTPIDSQLVTTAKNDVLIFFNQADASRQEALRSQGVELHQITSQRPSAGLPLPEVLRLLGQKEITTLLLEGGAELLTAALNEEVVDRLLLFYAPRLFGQTGTPMIRAMERPPHIHEYKLRRVGEDFAFEAYLRNPWQALQSK